MLLATRLITSLTNKLGPLDPFKFDKLTGPHEQSIFVPIPPELLTPHPGQLYTLMRIDEDYQLPLKPSPIPNRLFDLSPD